MRVPKRLYVVFVRRHDGASVAVHSGGNRRAAKDAASWQEARPDIDQIWTEMFVRVKPRSR